MEPDILLEMPNAPDEMDLDLKKFYLSNRFLIFNRDVDSDLIEDFVLNIMRWNIEDIDVPVEKRKPIRLIINSRGGSPFSGNALVSAIMTSKTPVYGIGMGLVASAAFDIFLACEKRYAFSTCVVMMHDGGIDIQTSSKKAKDTVEFLTMTMAEKDKEFVLSRTNMNADFYDSKYGEEFYMYSDTAKELGIVHKIIGIDCEMDDVL